MIEQDFDDKKTRIIDLGVRVNPLSTDEKTNFEKGKPITTNTNRTQKRGARRNLERYKLRRENLIEILIEHHFITKETPLAEVGKNTTHETLRIRAKSAKEKVSLEDLARILLAINKKRGYKSSRKINENEGKAIDVMAVAKKLYDENLTPAQYALQLLNANKRYIPDFYRSDLKAEFNAIWTFQKQFYPTILTVELYNDLQDKNGKQTWAICKEPFNIEGIELAEKGNDLKKKKYQLRINGLSEQLDLESLAIVFQEINNDLNNSSGYLGAISDRSKKLYFNKETVGEYQWKQIQKNPHTSLKNQVFYRQDYLDEFEQIWETQAKFYPEILTLELKEEIRDVIIFYQRKLKSQKGLLSFCQFESWEVNKTDKEGNIIIDKNTKLPKKKRMGKKVISKSSPLFQECKIWQNINNLTFSRTNKLKRNLLNQKIEEIFILDEENRNLLFEELNLRGKLSQKEILKLFKLKPKEWKTNYSEDLEGNNTNASLYNVYQKIAENEGYGFDWNKKTAKEIKEELRAVFSQIGINTDILNFNANLKGKELENQASYQLWHLLYSAEGDQKISDEDQMIYGTSAVSLKKNLVEKFGFKPEYSKWLANISLQQDYGNLSSKAIRKIIPFLQDGHNYSEACQLAGYNHSNSLTKEENENRPLAEKLALLPKNSLRNPVVEKILNQMVNVVNEIIKTYGKPDEVRIELARELKKSAKERKEMTSKIEEATKRNEDLKKLITKEFGIPNPTKNDIIRFRLWKELEPLAHKDIFTGKEIKPNDLFSKNIDIEHIIPKALLFDDSFSNKTLAFKNTNIKKANRTGYDFINGDTASDLEGYLHRIETLYNAGKGSLSEAKYKKLLMSQYQIPDGFIERDLRNSQYISKMARTMLLKAVKNVVVTTGSITDKLREDWGLTNIMKELNLPKYRALGLTKREERLDVGKGEIKVVEIIEDWTKRNDHRHHAMDALTVAFTTHSHIQYLNYLDARRDENHEKHSDIIGIEKKITYEKTKKNGKKKRKFIEPMPNFRSEAKQYIESILISIKAKNKVVTINKNYTKGGNSKPQRVLTPRGQLHEETIYGKIKRPLAQTTKLNKRFSLEKANLIINPKEKELILNHLSKFNNNPEIAFNTKTLEKEPILFNNEPIEEVRCFEEIFTIRKPITPDLKVKDVIDEKIKAVLENRLKAFNNNAKKAFSDLDKNPIWLNKEKGISIKRVTIKSFFQNMKDNAIDIKRNELGNPILDENGKEIPNRYVNLGNNHHVAIYRDKKGKLQEKVVSFFEAVTRANQGLPIIDKEYNKHLGWEFLFTMKQNEMFIFPNDDFDINEIDLLDEKNATLISKHLFRVQSISSKYYLFNHHLETKAVTGGDLQNKKMLSGITYHFIQSEQHLEGIIKVRINPIGKIVEVGEYK